MVRKAYALGGGNTEQDGKTMEDRRSTEGIATERSSVRLLSVLCLVYALLLLYASLMPFDLTNDRASFDLQLHGAWRYWPFGTLHTSRPDILSNLMIYVPLGLLFSTRVTLARRPSRWAAFLVGVVISGAISATVEYGQAFTPSRVTSATDFLMNLIGGSAGAAAGSLLGARAWLRLTTGIREAYVKRPLVLVTGLMLLMLAADAAFPFLPTLDVSTVKHNIRQSAFTLEDGFSRQEWHHWVVARAGVYAVLTILLGASGRRDSPGRWIRAALLALCFAAALESGKLFIESRSANVANVLSSASGVLAALVLAALFRSGISPRLKRLLPVVLLGAYVVYFEWTPFLFTWDLSRLAEKLPKGAQWLPLYHYAMGGTANEVRLFLRTILVVGALTCFAALHWRGVGRGSGFIRIMRAAVLAGGLGFILEFGQFFLERVPSITDVFCFAVGGALGYWVYLSYSPKAQDPR